MTAINHALTGAAIGLFIGQTLLALPLALGSHFICDAIPHFGAKLPTTAMRSNLFRNYLIVEAGLCFLVVVSLSFARPQHWMLAAFCAFLAAAPDFLWIKRYRRARAHKIWRQNRFEKFAQNIQWFQRPIGGMVEVAWFIGAVILLRPFFA